MNRYILDDLIIYYFIVKYRHRSINFKLHRACYLDQRELVELVILKGADNLSRGLHGACQKGHRNLAEWLIKKGANPKHCYYVGTHCHKSYYIEIHCHKS